VPILDRTKTNQVLAGVYIVHTGIHLLTWPSPRYRLPVDALLIVFAGLALSELYKQLIIWRRGLSPI